MSRLRRLVLSDRYFFLSCRVLPTRGTLTESEFATLAQVIRERRKQHGFLLTAWVFLPDHWHAIVYPSFPLTISRVLEAIKVGATLRINRRRGERGVLLQGRFFDRALRTVKEYHEKVEYIHLNPVKRGLVQKPEDWKWSSMREYAGVSGEDQERFCGLRIDRVPLPFEVRTRI